MVDRRSGFAGEREALDPNTLRAHRTSLLRQTVAICPASSDFYRTKLDKTGITAEDITDLDAARVAADLKEAIRVRAAVERVAPGTIAAGMRRLDDRRSYA